MATLTASLSSPRPATPTLLGPWWSPIQTDASPRSSGPAPPDPTPSQPAGWSRTLALVLATGAGSGYAPVASGTAGAAVGALLFWPLAALAFPLYAVTVAGAIALAIWSAEIATRHWATDDDRRIVSDEIAGQLVTLAPLVFFGNPRSLGWVVTGFVLFRVYDVWKPGPARWLEDNLPGGLGVVLDDVMAGVFGAITLGALVLLARSWSA